MTGQQHAQTKRVRSVIQVIPDHRFMGKRSGPPDFVQTSGRTAQSDECPNSGRTVQIRNCSGNRA